MLRCRYVAVLAVGLSLAGCGRPATSPPAGARSVPPPAAVPKRPRATRVVTDLAKHALMQDSWWGRQGPQDKEPSPGAGKSRAGMRAEGITVGGKPEQAIILRAPDDAGLTFITFELTLPNDAAALHFDMCTPDKSESPTDPGTVIFMVRVISPELGDREVWESRYGAARWQPATVDLSDYAGRKVSLRLLNSWDSKSGRHTAQACWGQPELLGPG